jgi:hypothetical protein
MHTSERAAPREQRRRHYGHRITTRLTCCIKTVERVDEEKKGPQRVRTQLNGKRERHVTHCGHRITTRLTSCTMTIEGVDEEKWATTRQKAAGTEERNARRTCTQVGERQPRERRRRHCGHRITTRRTRCTKTVEGADEAKGGMTRQNAA